MSKTSLHSTVKTALKLSTPHRPQDQLVMTTSALFHRYSSTLHAGVIGHGEGQHLLLFSISFTHLYVRFTLKGKWLDFVRVVLHIFMSSVVSATLEVVSWTTTVNRWFKICQKHASCNGYLHLTLCEYQIFAWLVRDCWTTVTYDPNVQLII